MSRALKQEEGGDRAYWWPLGGKLLSKLQEDPSIMFEGQKQPESQGYATNSGAIGTDWE